MLNLYICILNEFDIGISDARLTLKSKFETVYQITFVQSGFGIGKCPATYRLILMLLTTEPAGGEDGMATDKENVGDRELKT